MQLLEIHAREVLKQPPEWKAFQWECFPKAARETLYVAVTGAVVVPCTCGPRKGKPNWRARDKRKDATAYITPAEHDAWKLKWERETGKCSRCQGEGKIVRVAGVNGTEYELCRACNGTGKPLPPAPETP